MALLSCQQPAAPGRVSKGHTSNSSSGHQQLLAKWRLVQAWTPYTAC
jgi:hypothetical protein